MATDTQYKVFKEVYDEELQRYSELESRAKLYLTVITFYIGVIGFKITDVIAFTSTFSVPVTLYIITAGILLLSLLLTMAAMRIYSYEGVCNLEQVIDSFGERPPADEDFLDDRLVDLAVATTRNTKINNRRGILLLCASILICLAVIVQLLIFVIALTNQRR
jgi:hypothetical protein